MQRYAENIAKLLEVVGGCLITYVLHTNMNGFDLEAWVVNAGTLGKQFSKQQRVLAARETDEHVVIILQQLVRCESAYEAFIKSFE